MSSETRDPEPVEPPQDEGPIEAAAQGGPVEIHPPHAPARSFKEFVIQLVTITAGS
ncbi:MAG: hypothetical protein ACRD2N_16905 [Vicinamibacterales bacterium]